MQNRQVTNVAIWGNHSATQFPDFAHARIDGTPVPEVIGDTAWLQGAFIETVQKRAAAVIEKRGASSAASAAHAAIGSVNSIHFATPGERLPFGRGVQLGRVRGARRLQFGYPVRSDGTTWSVVEGLEHERVRAGQDRGDDPGAGRRARRGAQPRPHRRVTREWSLRFADDHGVTGSLCPDPPRRHARSVHRRLTLPDEGVVVVHDDEVTPPRGEQLVVRAEGLWAELVCETPDEHWSFGLEAFGVRSMTSTKPRPATAGSVWPSGFDLEWEIPDRVFGELLLGRRRIEFDGTGTFTT